MNKVILSGNLTKDIDLRATTTGISALRNTVAVRNDYKSSNGEYESTFINFITFRNNAEYLNKYASKGTKVLIEGRWSNGSYEKDGKTIYYSEVVADKVEICMAKKEETTVAKTEQVETKEPDPYEEFGKEYTLDDSQLPF